MKNGTVRFGVVGLGMGRNHAKTIATNTERAELVAVCDLDEERVQGTAEELECEALTDYSALLGRGDIDAVFIGTPSGLHGEMAIQAARAGKHVITDKPMEITVERCEEVTREAKKAGVTFGVYFQHRFAQANRTIKRAIDEGEFGKLLVGEMRLKWFRKQEYYDGGGWRGTWAMDGGGALMNQSVHFVDLLVWFFGKPKAVTGMTDALNHKIETEDTGLAVVRFENGALATVLGTTCSVPSLGTEMAVHGQNASVLLHDDKVVRWETAEGPREHEVDPPYHPIQDFVDAVVEGRPPMVPGDEGVKSVQLITAVYESARTGRTVEIP